jgi:hypothetical protein
MHLLNFEITQRYGQYKYQNFSITLRFFRAFSSVVRKMPGYNSQRRGTARTSLFFIVIYVPFSVFCALFVCKCVLYCCYRVSTQLQLFKKIKKTIHLLVKFCNSSLNCWLQDEVKCYMWRSNVTAISRDVQTALIPIRGVGVDLHYRRWRNEPSVIIGQETGWAPAAVWTFRSVFRNAN